MAAWGPFAATHHMTYHLSHDPLVDLVSGNQREGACLHPEETIGYRVGEGNGLGLAGCGGSRVLGQEQLMFQRLVLVWHVQALLCPEDYGT